MTVQQDQNLNDDSYKRESEYLSAAKKTKLKNILTSGKFIHLFVLAVCHLFYGYFFTNVYKQYAKDYINDDEFLTWVGAFGAIFNGCFKFIWATALDYYPFKRIYGGLITLEVFLIVIV